MTDLSDISPHKRTKMPDPIVFINGVQFPHKVKEESKLIESMMEDQEEDNTHFDFPKLGEKELRLFHTFVAQGPAKLPALVFWTNPMLDRSLALGHFLDAPKFKESIFKLIHQKQMPIVNYESYLNFLDRTTMVPLGLKLQHMNNLVFVEQNYSVFESMDLLKEYLEYWTAHYHKDPDTKRDVGFSITYDHNKQCMVVGPETCCTIFKCIGPNFMTYNLEQEGTDLYLTLKEHVTKKYPSKHKLVFNPTIVRFSIDGKYLMAKYHDLYTIWETQTGKVIRDVSATSKEGSFFNDPEFMVEKHSTDYILQPIDPTVPYTKKKIPRCIPEWGNVHNVCSIQDYFVVIYIPPMMYGGGANLHVEFIGKMDDESYFTTYLPVRTRDIRILTNPDHPDTIIVKSHMNSFRISLPYKTERVSKEEVDDFTRGQNIKLFRM